jgi:hypothetical protein
MEVRWPFVRAITAPEATILELERPARAMGAGQRDMNVPRWTHGQRLRLQGRSAAHEMWTIVWPRSGTVAGRLRPHQGRCSTPSPDARARGVLAVIRGYRCLAPH